MSTSMHCLYGGVDYTYIDVNALVQGIKSFFGLTSLVSSRCWGSNIWHRFTRNFQPATLTIRPIFNSESSSKCYADNNIQSIYKTIEKLERKILN